MIAVLLLVLLSGAAGSPPGDGRAGDVHPSLDYQADLDTLLQAIVLPDGSVQYDVLRGRQNARFRHILKAIEDFDPVSLSSQQEKLAFWINAYNVQMLQNIAENPRVRDIIVDGYADAFFQTPFRTARSAMTLNELEHVILRRQKGRPTIEALQVSALDPRIHVAINCAAVSCPPLRSSAYRASTIDRVLDDAMRDFVNSPKLLRRQREKWIVSSILDWFGEDFEQAGTAGDYLLRYVLPRNPAREALQTLFEGKSAASLRTNPDVRFEYDWSVNAAR